MKSMDLKLFIPIFLLIASFTSSRQIAADAPKIEIERKSVTDGCITGYLILNGEAVCHTLELPWIGNINNISSIPEGDYTGYVRTDGSKGWRIELDYVPACRTNIQIHVGNYTSDIQGCTLIGMRTDIDKCTVYDSKKAMEILKSQIEPLLGQHISVIYSKR